MCGWGEISETVSHRTQNSSSFPLKLLLFRLCRRSLLAPPPKLRGWISFLIQVAVVWGCLLIFLLKSQSFHDKISLPLALFSQTSPCFRTWHANLSTNKSISAVTRSLRVTVSNLAYFLCGDHPREIVLAWNYFWRLSRSTSPFSTLKGLEGCGFAKVNNIHPSITLEIRCVGEHRGLFAPGLVLSGVGFFSAVSVLWGALQCTTECQVTPFLRL